MKALFIATMLLGGPCRAARVTDCGSTLTTRRSVQGRPARAVHPDAIPGIELLRVDTVPEATGAACEVATGRLLQGQEGFRRAASLVGDDPTALALLSSMLLEEPGVAGRTVHTDPVTAGGGDTAPSPPIIDGRRLIYWRVDKTLDNDVRVTVDLDTLTVDTALDTTIAADAAAPTDPIERARLELQDADLSQRLAGVARLDGLQSSAADQLLVQVLLEDEHWQVRKEVARRLGQRQPPPAGAIDALCRSLLLDGTAEVRGQAATALGSIGDPRAREQLQAAAARDGDPGVRALATAALQRIGG